MTAGNHAYPRTITQIPYASFMRITKWSYNKGMAEVGAAQNDAIGSIQNSGLVKQVADSLSGSAKWAYGIGGNPYTKNFKDKEGNVLTGEAEQAAAIELARQKMPIKNSVSSGNTTLRADVNDVEFEDTVSDEEYLKKPFKGRNGKMTTLKETLDKKNKVRDFNANGYKQKHCNLALPNEFQYQYGATWGNTFKLGTMALLADDPAAMAKNSVFGGGIGAGGSVLKELIKGQKDERGKDNIWAQIGKGFGSGAKKAGDLWNVNSSIVDPTNIVGLAGLAPNENAIQFFKKMEFRQFELNFEFASRNRTESRVIQNIIKWFKIGMHPASQDPLGSGSGVLLGFPDVFVLQPQFVPVKNGEAQGAVNHKMMPKTKLCALQGLNVNATPFGSVNTIFDGTIPLITVTMRFTELTALTRADFRTDEYL